MANSQRKHNFADQYLSTLSKSSRSTFRYQLNRIALMLGSSDYRSVNWSNITEQKIEELIRNLFFQGLSSNTITLNLSIIKNILRVATLGGEFDCRELEKIRMLKAPLGPRLRADRKIIKHEVAALFEVCLKEGSSLGIRDAAVLALLCFLGLQRSKITDLWYPDCLNEDFSALRFKGRGERVFENPLPAPARKIIHRWLAIRGTHPGPLICRIQKNGKVLFTRITPQTIYYIVRQRSFQSKLQAYSPNDFRKFFASYLLSEDSLLLVRDLLGISTTSNAARYVRRSKKHKREIVNQFAKDSGGEQ